jgi:hypothetical protein
MVMPIRSVNTGFKELSIPVRELSILVSAIGKRNAGIALPRNPIIDKLRMLCLLIFFMLIRAKGRRLRKVMNMRNDAICNEENDSSPFFIRI